MVLLLPYDLSVEYCVICDLIYVYMLADVYFIVFVQNTKEMLLKFRILCCINDKSQICVAVDIIYIWEVISPW